MPTLSRADMEAVIDSGGGVIHNGNIIIEKSKLPTEADLAKGDPAKEGEAASNLQARIDELQSQLALLQEQNTEKDAELETLRVGELRERAAAAGIENSGQMKKDELLVALQTTTPPQS